jgi:hypothetical protein
MGHLGLGAVAESFMSPAKTIQRLAALERMGDKVKAKMDGGLSRFFSGKGKSVESAASVKALQGSGGARETFERAVDQVRTAASNPAAHSDLISKGMPWADVAPRLATSFAAKASVATQYLAAHAPTEEPLDIARGKDHPKMLYSDTEMREWSRRAAVVHDPTVVYDSLARGTLTPEEVDAFRVVYPEMYRDEQTKIVERLSTESVDRDKRLALQTLFNAPVESDMRPDSVALFQSLYAAAPSPEGASPQASTVPEGRAMKVNVVQNYQTPSTKGP